MIRIHMIYMCICHIHGVTVLLGHGYDYVPRCHLPPDRLEILTGSWITFLSWISQPPRVL